MRKDWETKILDQVCLIKTGKKDVNQGNPNGKYPFFTCAREYTFSDTYSFDSEAILIAGNGEVGICHYYNGKFEAYQRTYVLSDFIADIDVSYLYYFVEGKLRDEFRDRRLGNAMPYIRVGMLKDIAVPVPSFTEQKRIVGILDEKFKAIEELKKVTEAQVQDAKELFESRLNIIFGMSEENILPLSDVCKITSSKRVYKADYVKSGVPFYRTKEIKELAHNKQPTTELFIKRDSFDEITSKFGKPEAGDLMLTAIGTIGEIYIVEDKDEFYFKDGNILWLKNIKGVTVGYLRYALNFFVKEIQSLAVGSAYKALTIEKLNNHKIPVPKKEIQNDTVKELDELSIKTQELMEVFQNKIINLEELKKSYLEQAFAGKL